MKRISFRLILLCSCFFVYACNTASPEKYFDVAVLNTNMLHGFADRGFLREFESPSMKLDQSTNQAVPMKRKEVVDTKIAFLEQSLSKVKALGDDGEAGPMVKNSVQLYEYVLPVYKNEYSKLAGLYDSGAPKEEISAFAQSIHDKYYPRFDELYTSLISLGKDYAKKHSIQVSWGM